MMGTNSFILFAICSVAAIILLIGTAEGAFLNIQSQGSGFCFRRIPQNSTAEECSSDEFCREITNHPTNFGLKCGNYGECILEHLSQEEFCKDACGSSACGKICLQEHETKIAQYCIKTRDHPNANPPGFQESNKFYCVCTVPNYFNIY